MRYVSATLTAALGLLVMCSVVVADPVPAPTASSTAGPCASALPDLSNDLPTAFAYDLVPVKMLRFIEVLGNVPEKNQKAVFSRVVAAANAPEQRAIEAKLEGYCANLDGIYGQTRALAGVANLWTLNDIHDEKGFESFSRVVDDEIAVLSLGETIDPDVRTSAAEPFAMLDRPNAASPEPSATPAGKDACASASAHVVHAVQPTYPSYARAAGLSGTVRIKVTLDALGLVESARVYTDTLKAQTGSDAVILQSIFSAAASTYAPEIVACKPVAGSYIFTVDFKIR